MQDCGIQDWWDAGGMQYSRYEGKERCRTGWMKDRRETDIRVKDRRDEGQG